MCVGHIDVLSEQINMSFEGWYRKRFVYMVSTLRFCAALLPAQLMRGLHVGTWPRLPALNEYD